MRAMSNRPDLFQVMAEQCDACLFTKDRVVDGPRAAQIIRDCKARGSHFICHKATLDGGKNVCCKAFYETQDTMVIRMAKALDRVVFVTPGGPNAED